MKRILRILSVLCILLFVGISFAATGPFPNKEFGQDMGKKYRSYNDLYLKNTIYFEGATSDAYYTKFAITDPTANRTITFPNSSGTVALSAVGLTWDMTGTSYKTTLTATEPTANRVFTLPNYSGTAMISTLATNEPAVANSVWAVSNGLVFENAAATYYTKIASSAVTADRTITLPDASGVPILASGVPGAAASVFGASNSLVFEGATADEFETTLTVVDPTVDRTITLPNASGTVKVACGTSHDYAGDHADWTMTIAEASCGYIATTNAAVGGANAILPSCVAGEYYTVYNTSGQTVTLKVTGQTGAAVVTAKKGLFVCTGTDVLQVYTTP
jgi:hypothetical protein